MRRSSSDKLAACHTHLVLIKHLRISDLKALCKSVIIIIIIIISHNSIYTILSRELMTLYMGTQHYTVTDRQTDTKQAQNTSNQYTNTTAS